MCSFTRRGEEAASGKMCPWSPLCRHECSWNLMLRWNGCFVICLFLQIVSFPHDVLCLQNRLTFCIFFWGEWFSSKDEPIDLALSVVCSYKFNSSLSLAKIVYILNAVTICCPEDLGFGYSSYQSRAQLLIRSMVSILYQFYFKRVWLSFLRL